MRPLTHVGIGRGDRLDVDDDVRFRQRRLDDALDRVGRGMALPDPGVVADGDDDVREEYWRLIRRQPDRIHERLA